MQTPTVIVTVLLLAATAVGPAGCGRDNPPPAAEPAPTSAVPAPEPTGAPEPATGSPMSPAPPAPPAPPPTTPTPKTALAPRGPAPPGPAPPGLAPPPVRFEPPQLDFGTLAPRSKADGRITIHNTGSRDLRILASRTSCGCTAARNLDGRVIDAGGSITFDTSMKLKSGLGGKKERITIVFEGHRPIEYFLTAEASLGVRAVPPHLTATGALTGRVDLVATDGGVFRVLSAGGAPPRFVGFDPASDPPRDRYTLEWDLTALDRAGRVPWFWLVETDRADCPIVDLRIRHRTTKPTQPRGRTWVPKDQRILVGAIEAGTPFEFDTHIEYASGLRVPSEGAAIASGSPGLVVELVRAWPDDPSLYYRVRATVTDAPPGPFHGSVTLKASGFETALLIFGRVVE